MNHRPSAFANAFLSLFGFSSCLAKAAASDFERLLRSQPELPTLEPAQLAVRQAETRASTIKRRNLLRLKTVKSLFWVLSGAALGMYFITLVLAPETDPPAQSVLAIATMICFAWATLGRLGWAGQSFKGETIFEELDTGIFWALYWLGACLATAALAIPAA